MRHTPAGETTLAGWWYLALSLLVFSVSVLAVVRAAVDSVDLLGRIARLHLHVMPTHPDLAGGNGATLALAHEPIEKRVEASASPARGAYRPSRS